MNNSQMDCTAPATIMEGDVKLSISRIKRILNKKINDDTPDYVIADLYQRERAVLDKLVSSAIKSYYSYTSIYKEDIAEEASQILQETQLWIEKLENEYAEREINSSSPSTVQLNLKQFDLRGDMKSVRAGRDQKVTSKRVIMKSIRT